MRCTESHYQVELELNLMFNKSPNAYCRALTRTLLYAYSQDELTWDARAPNAKKRKLLFHTVLLVVVHHDDWCKAAYR
jgi:hypothetical protein